MTKSEIKKIIKNSIIQIAEDQSLEVGKIEDHFTLTEDLGFRSLDIATLASLLEINLDVDPFIDNLTAVTEIRTVEDLCKVYIDCRFKKELVS